MPTPSHHLAQLNITRLIAPMESPLIKEFRDFLDPVNQLGAESPGFVWRFTEDTDEAISDKETQFPDERVVVNMTVWENLETLHDFVYKTVHSYFLKSRGKWFYKSSEHQVVLWWVPVGHFPDLAEANARLKYLQENGPSPAAFTMAQGFDAEGNPLK